VPPDGKSAPRTADGRKIDREDEQAKRDHPKSQDRQEAEEPTSHQQNAEADPRRPRLGQMKMMVGKADFVGHASLHIIWSVVLSTPDIDIAGQGRNGRVPRR